MKAKRFCKNTLLWAIEKSGLESVRDQIWTWAGSLPAAVLVFHRVTDVIPEDGITISTARFRTIVKTLKDHYRPVPLTDLIGNLLQKKPWQERTVAITFDDGYDDNLNHAAPILREYGVPATFFVTVDLIGTQRVLPWEEHLAGRIRWMDWNQVRRLHSLGFAIGSHTLTHCDLGKVSGPTAKHEICESKHKLQDTLGTEIPLFAYPFGRADNLTSENRDLVRQAGYKCCCSAFGGFVRGDSDPFALCRIGIDNWYATMEDLHFELRRIPPWRWFDRD